MRVEKARELIRETEKNTRPSKRINNEINGGLKGQKMKQEHRLEIGKLLVISVIAVIGLLLVVGSITGGPADVEAQADAGGLEAITEVKTCDVVALEGRLYAICDDGAQYVLQEIESPLAEALEGQK